MCTAIRSTHKPFVWWRLSSLISGHLQVIPKAKISRTVFFKETGPSSLLLSRVERKLHFMFRHRTITRDTVSSQVKSSFPLISERCFLLLRQRLSSKKNPGESKCEKIIWSVPWKWREGRRERHWETVSVYPKKNFYLREAISI